MSKRLIYAEDAIEALAKELKGVFVEYRDIAEKLIGKLPSAQPQRMKGRWYDGRCLRCGEHAPFHPMASAYYESNFCPNCGADMRGEQE